MSFLALVGIIFFFLKKKDFDSQWPWILLFSGGLSNFLERIFFGCVLDYISIPFFPIFNVADVLLTLGVVVLLWRLRPIDKDDSL